MSQVMSHKNASKFLGLKEGEGGGDFCKLWFSGKLMLGKECEVLCECGIVFNVVF